MPIPYVSDPRPGPNFVAFDKTFGLVAITIKRSSPSGRTINLDFLPANLVRNFVGVPSVQKVHPGGNCDLGDWRMPFSITLLR